MCDGIFGRDPAKKGSATVLSNRRTDDKLLSDRPPRDLKGNL